MKTKTTLSALAAFFAGIAICLAADPNMGTWKLNEAKSKMGKGATKNHTVVYAAVGDNVKITVDAITSDGKAVHQEWTGKYDGKDYPVTGDPTHDMRSYRKTGERTLEFDAKKDGKLVGTGRVAVAADGKSRRVTSTLTDPSGKKATSIAIYDKQ